MPGLATRWTRVLLTYAQCKESKEALVEFLESNWNLASYCVCHENHKETEGEHLHAYICLRASRVDKAEKFNKQFDFKGHHPNIEKVGKGKVDMIRVLKYLHKDGDYIEMGVNLEALENGVKKMKSTVEQNKILLTENVNQLVEKGLLSPYQYTNILHAQYAYKLYDPPEDCEHVRGIFISGPAGCGKTTAAREFGKKHGGIFIKAQNKWFDGYFGEPVIVLDDLDTDTLFHYLKMWGDKWKCRGEVKGATCWLKHKWFVVTSNKNLESLSDGSMVGIQALKRRFVEIDCWNFKEGQYLSVDDIEKAIGSINEEGEVNEPDPKRTPECSLVDSLFGSGYQ